MNFQEKISKSIIKINQSLHVLMNKLSEEKRWQKTKTARKRKKKKFEEFILAYNNQGIDRNS